MARENQQTPFTSQAEAFGTFLKYTDQKAIQHEAVITGLQDYQAVWQRATTQGQSFEALYVGVGTGGLEVPLTAEFVQRRNGTTDGIAVHCVDPSPQMRERFMTNARAAGIESAIAAYTLAPFESEQYQVPSVDLAVASHVFYYIDAYGIGEDGMEKVPFDNNALVRVARAVKPRQGVATIALQSQESDNTKLRQKYSPIITGNEEKYGEQLTDELERLGISYTSQIIEAHTDVSACFDARGRFNPNADGEKLLTFITRAPGGWNAVEQEVKEEFAADFSQIVEQNGSPVMNFRDTYIWIPGDQL